MGELNIGFVIAPTGEEVEFWDIAAVGDEPPCDEQGCYIKTMVHPAFTVENLAASKAFYEALGIRPKVDWGWGCSMLMDDNREIELFSGGHVCNNTGGITHAVSYTHLDVYKRQVQTLCGAFSSPHCGHLENAGTSSFHTLERLLCFLCFDILFFGAIIKSTSYMLSLTQSHCFMFRFCPQI